MSFYSNNRHGMLFIKTLRSISLFLFYFLSLSLFSLKSAFLPVHRILLRPNEASDELRQASSVFEKTSAKEHATQGFTKRKRVRFDWVL
jgi:hypothetical protein